MHQQHRTADARDGGDRRDVVEAIADRLLHVVEDVAADRLLGDALGRQPAPHHRRRVRERRHADHRRHLRRARGREQHRAGTDRMAEQRDAGGVDTLARGEPREGVLGVLGKARQRGEAVVVARAVAARIDEQRRVAGLVQRARERQHQRRVAAPAVHHHHRRRGRGRHVRFLSSRGGRHDRIGKRGASRPGDEPRMQRLAVLGADAQRLERQPERARLRVMRHPRRRQALADPPMHQRPPTGQRGRAGGEGRDQSGCAHSQVLLKPPAAETRPSPHRMETRSGRLRCATTRRHRARR